MAIRDRNEPGKLGTRFLGIAERSYEQAKAAHEVWIHRGKPPIGCEETYSLGCGVIDNAVISVISAAAGIEGEGVLILQFMAHKFPAERRLEFFEQFLIKADQPDEWRTRNWKNNIRPCLKGVLQVLEIKDFDWGLVDEIIEIRNNYMHPKGKLTTQLSDTVWHFKLLESMNPDEAMDAAKKAHDAVCYVFKKYHEVHDRLKLMGKLSQIQTEALLMESRS